MTIAEVIASIDRLPLPEDSKLLRVLPAVTQIVEKINVKTGGTLVKGPLSNILKIANGTKLATFISKFRFSQLEVDFKEALDLEKELINLVGSTTIADDYMGRTLTTAVKRLSMAKRRIILHIEVTGRRVPPELKMDRLINVATGDYDDVEQLIVELKELPPLRLSHLTELLPLIVSIFSDLREEKKNALAQAGISTEKFNIMDILDEQSVRSIVRSVNSQGMLSAEAEVIEFERRLAVIQEKYECGSMEERQRVDYALALLDSYKVELLTQKIKVEEQTGA